MKFQYFNLVTRYGDDEIDEVTLEPLQGKLAHYVPQYFDPSCSKWYSIDSNTLVHSTQNGEIRKAKPAGPYVV